MKVGPVWRTPCYGGAHKVLVDLALKLHGGLIVELAVEPHSVVIGYHLNEEIGQIQDRRRGASGVGSVDRLVSLWGRCFFS